jgi:hypothetical protein
MKKILINIITVNLFLTIWITAVNAQYGKVEEITFFENTLHSPVEMDVQQKDNKILFNAINSSFFPYELVIKFSTFQNLTPRIFEKGTILHHGKNYLFIVSIIDPEQSPQYSYSVEYIMGTPVNKADIMFPYLIPIGEGKSVKLASSNENGEKKYWINNFKLHRNDTIFCVRKGWVTALPDNKTETDRIIKSSSLEICHTDGTIAVYMGIDPESDLVELGQVVYPGQPIGEIGESENLAFNIYEFQGGGKIRNIEVFYSDKNGQVISSKKIMDTEVFFPEAIIKKEMTNKELKKYEKNALY